MSESKKEALREKVDRIVKVSTIPAVVSRIISVTEDSGSNVHDLEKVIEHDQAIASRVVGLSNAVYYGFPRKITSISQAVLVLGFDMVKGLAVSTAVFEGFNSFDRVMMTDLWHHSFETATASVLVAERSGIVNKDLAFLAGLLHDIGKPIMCQIFNREYTNLTADDTSSLIAQEEEAIGAGHAEVGSWFADKCKLPSSCINSIKYHHNPELFRSPMNGNPLSVLVPIVYLANLIVLDGQENHGRFTEISRAQAQALQEARISGENLIQIQEAVAAQRSQITQYYA